jgi:hypothetical protein
VAGAIREAVQMVERKIGWDKRRAGGRGISLVSSHWDRWLKSYTSDVR